MRCTTTRLAALLMVAIAPGTADSAFVVEADNVAPAGKASDHFSSLGFQLSTTPSTALGLTGNQSAFGNPTNNTGPDRYIFSYTPGTDADNTVYATNTILGNSYALDPDGAGPGLPIYDIFNSLATGSTGGGSGYYNVYITAPPSTNVNAAGSTITVSNDDSPIVLNPVIMNNGSTGPDSNPDAPFTGGANSMWLKIADFVPLTAGNTHTVTVEANANPPDFVSQRTHGVMWEFVEPFGENPDFNEDGTVDAADYAAWRKLPSSFGGDPAGYNL